MDEGTGFMLENKVYYEGKNKQSERKRRSSFWNLYFNEIHQYEDYKNINVFTTGLGKKKHPRRSYYTTMVTCGKDRWMICWKLPNRSYGVANRIMGYYHLSVN